MIRRFIILILLFFGGITSAQEQDFRTWIEFELEGELFNLIDFSITPEARLENNSTHLDDLLGEIDLSVPLTKWLRTGLEYRYQLSFDYDDQISNTNRFGAYLELDERIADFRLAYRAMYLHEYTDIYTSEQGRIPESMHRHKLSVKYRKKGWKITPGLAAEGFYTLSPVWDRNKYKWRFTTGVQFRLTKDINLGVNYKFQREFNQNNPLTAHILNMGLEYEL